MKPSFFFLFSSSFLNASPSPKKTIKTPNPWGVLILFLLLLFLLLQDTSRVAYAGGGAGNMIDCSTGQYTQVPDASNLDLLTQHTIEVWFKADSFPVLGGLVGKYHSNAANGWMLRLHRNSPFASLEIDEAYGSSSNILSTARWYHVAGTRNGSTVALYLNGNPVALTGTALFQNNNTNPVTFCVDFLFGGPRYFDGQIDEVRVWSVPLTQAQIQANMFRTLSGSEANLQGYWKLDEASGQTITDTSGGNDGFLGANNSDAGSDPLRLTSSAPIGNGTVTNLNNVTGIWYLGNTSASSGGLTLANSTFFNAVGDDIIFAHDGAINENVNSDLPTGGVWVGAPNPGRWVRTWYLDKSDLGTTGGNITFTFDYSNAGMSAYTPSGTLSNYRLIYRSATTGQFQDIAGATSISGDQVIFSGVATLGAEGPNAVADGYYTLGTLDNTNSPTALTLQSFTARADMLPVMSLLALIGLGLIGLVLRRRS